MKKLDLGFHVTAREMAAIKAGMQTYAAATRTPKLTFSEWRVIAEACAIASAHLAKNTDGEKRTPAYTKPMSGFLAATGLAALNGDDLACAMRMLPDWGTIAAWRDTLPPSRRANNPRQVLAAYEARTPSSRHKDPYAPA